jgi:hypothetical protein
MACPYLRAAMIDTNGRVWSFIRSVTRSQSPSQRALASSSVNNASWHVGHLIVNKRSKLTPQWLDGSIAWRADRRRDPTPIHKPVYVLNSTEERADGVKERGRPRQRCGTAKPMLTRLDASLMRSRP